MTTGIQSSTPFLDIIQSDLILNEFENILEIKRGKMMSALKIEQIYDKIHTIEKIVKKCSESE